MSASLGAREAAGRHSRGHSAPPLPPMVTSRNDPHLPAGAQCSFVDLGDSSRVALMLTPVGRGSFAAQVEEVLDLLDAVLKVQPQSMRVTTQTVFLRDPEEAVACLRLLRRRQASPMPVTNFVLQPPCSGAALAMEAWAIGGPGVRVEAFGEHALAVSYDGVRWVYCAGIEAGPEGGSGGVYAQTKGALERLGKELRLAGTALENSVRTWFYLGGITDLERGTERYREFNRARTDFYQHLRFGCSVPQPNIPHGVYPASTGIGMQGTGLVVGCMTLQTSRQDILLLPLENPQQTPAYAYHPRHSPKSPKFSRAMALLLGGYATTWISGTASIVNSESRHLDDIERQTEQTIDNIERLIAPENFTFHGAPGTGAALRDLAKVRVYVKRKADFARCRAICERRFGKVPAVYALADVCRPELLVEIEGVAFSRCRPVEPR